MENVTMKKDLIIPEVVSDMVESHFGGRISLLPVTEIDRTLEGVAGDTLKFPCFRYIGKADQVDENGEVKAGLLSADTVEAKVCKYAKAVCITDEARLSGFGDPVGEAARQLAQAMDHALDEKLYQLLGDLPLCRKAAVKALSADAVTDALTLFGEEMEGEKLLFTDASGFAALRKDPAYIRASDLGQRMICSGVVGEIWGCQIVITSRIKEDEEKKEKQYFIVKPGALHLVSKQGTTLEVHREPQFMRDTLYASKHCACYLYDAGKAAALTVFSGLEHLDAACGIQCMPGDAAGRTVIRIPDTMLPPAGLKWVYLLDSDAEDKGTYGTAVTGAKAWPGNAASIATGNATAVHLLLVDGAMKPVKTLTVMAVTP